MKRTVSGLRWRPRRDADPTYDWLMVVIVLFLMILELLFALLASLAASKGELYAYPMSLNLIKG